MTLVTVSRYRLYVALLAQLCHAQAFQPRNGVARPRNVLAARQESGGEKNRLITLNDHEDFCVFGSGSAGDKIAPESAVRWCTKGAQGGHQIPAGAIQGVTYIKATNWVQVSGTGDLSQINISPDDLGRQLDSASHRPEGARVVVNGQEAATWVSMISGDTFCFRACIGDPKYCPMNFAQQGCYVYLSNAVGWAGTFQTCTSDDGLPPGEQGDHAPEWRDCRVTGQAPPNGDTNRPSTYGDGNGESPGPTPTTEAVWVPQETCVPCGAPAPTDGRGNNHESAGVSQTHEPLASPATATSTDAGNPSDVRSALNEDASPTMQQGVSPVGPDAGNARGNANALYQELEHDGGSSPRATITPAPGDQEQQQDTLLGRRGQDAAPAETFTRDGMCCHTIWVTAVSATSQSQTASATATEENSNTVTGVDSPSRSSATGASSSEGLIMASGSQAGALNATGSPTLTGTMGAPNATITSGRAGNHSDSANATGAGKGTQGGGGDGVSDLLGGAQGLIPASLAAGVVAVMIGLWLGTSV